MPAMAPAVHRVESAVRGTPVNAYVIEGEHELVAVDATLTVSGGCMLRARIDEIGKPLSALVLTHAHPDHYGGAIEAVAATETPIVATAGVNEVIRRDDAAKEEILRPMFGEEWPRKRAFPTRVVDDGAELSFGDIELTVGDLGPGESFHDSIWFLGEGRATVFSGDQGYNHMHCYLADGHWEDWLANIESLCAALSPEAILLPGHGDPAGVELLDWQRGYIERFLEAVRRADFGDTARASESVVRAMGDYLGSDRLRFLMELSIEPVAMKLGLLGSTADER